MNTFGVLNYDNVHTDVSSTEKGAKNYATRHGYKKVSISYNCGYHVDIVAVKSASGKWMPGDWEPQRITVYKVMVGSSCVFDSTDELAANSYAHSYGSIHSVKGIITVYKGWKLV